MIYAHTPQVDQKEILEVINEKPKLKQRTDIISEQLHDVSAMINRTKSLVDRIYPMQEQDKENKASDQPPIGCLIDEMDEWNQRLYSMQERIHDLVKHLESLVGE